MDKDADYWRGAAIWLAARLTTVPTPRGAHFTVDDWLAEAEKAVTRVRKETAHG